MRSRRVICLWAVAALGIAVIASPSVSLANQASDQLNAGVQLFNEGEYGQARLLLLRVEVEDLSDAERAERNRLITEASIAQNQVGKAHREKAEADLLLSKGETGKATRLYESILSNRYASADMKEHAALNLKRIAGGLPSATQPTTQPTLVPKAPENPSPAQTDEASALGPSPARANASADSTPDINAANVPAHSAGAAVAEAEEFVGPIAPETLLAQSAEPTTEATGASQGNRPVEAAHEREGVSERGPGQTTEREVGPPANGGDLQPVQPTLPVVAQAGRTDEELDELSRAIPQQELAAEVVSENRAPAGPASQPVAEATPEARAQAAEEAKAARAALDKGELGAATEHYRKALQLVPGYPEAVEGLSEIEQFETIDENASLVDKIRQRKAIQWQKADTIYREADRDVRQAVTEHRYQDARKALEYARQTLEANRANAEPASLYEDLKREAESLARYVDDEERKYEEDQVKRAMEEVEQAQRRRQEEAEQAKQQKVAQLMDQALQLRREKRFAEAADVLKQVMVIDVQNEKAKWLKEELEAIVDYRHQRETNDDLHRELARTLMEVRDDMVPWSAELMRFPKEWREITVRRERLALKAGAESEADLQIQKKLEQTLPEIKLDQVPFGQAIEFLREQQGVNIHVVWKALQNLDIDRETPVTVEQLTNTPFSAVLEAILESLTAEPGEVGYIIDKGRIVISTKEALAGKMVTQRYEVKDLLQDIPDFYGSSGGGMYSGMGGMGGGMGGYGGGMGGYGGRSQEDMAEELRYLITELIDRKSWKDNDGEGSIEFYRGMFIITNTAEVHRKVAKLLKELREEMNVQVAVEALFITVGNNFLESIGLDLDVILNNGNAGYDYANSAGTRLTDPSTGSAILIPRRNSRLGFVPSPAPGGSQMAQVTPDQPYAGAGFVPLASDTGPSWSRMTPIGLRQDSLSAATPQANPVPGSLGGGAVGDALSLAGTFLDGIQVDFLIRATQADRRSSFLQAPRIVVPNGRYGSLAVTEDQAYVASLEAVAAGGSVGGQGAIGYTPVIDVVSQGRQLLVSATVSPDRRYVTMTIEPSVQEILAMRQFGVQQGGYSSGVLGIGNVVLPEIRTTMVSTSATVPDGGTLLLGGLKLGGETEVDAGVPVLNKIPVLKRAFSNRSLVKDEQTLLILVKPKIILQDEIEENNFPGFAQASKE